MISDLVAYREWYGALSKEAQSSYAKSLGSKQDLFHETQVRTLAREFLGKEVTGCGFCLLSAHFELIKLDMATIKNKTSEYQVLAGVVLHDPVNKDFSKILTAANVTESLALYHIAHNPRALQYFSRVPEDLQARLQKYLENEGAKTTLTEQEVLNARIAAAEKELETAKKGAETASESLKAAQSRVSLAEDSLASLRSFIKPADVSKDTEKPTSAAKSKSKSAKKTAAKADESEA